MRVHPLELNRQTGFEGVRGANSREVIDDLYRLCDPFEHRVIGGVADLGISARSHRGCRPGKRIGRDPFDAQLLNPVAREGVNGTALTPKLHEPDVQFINRRRREAVRISEGKLQVVVGLFLIESGECRRERLSHAAIERSVPGKSAPDRISASRPIVNSRCQDVVIGPTCLDGRCSCVRSRRYWGPDTNLPMRRPHD